MYSWFSPAALHYFHLCAAAYRGLEVHAGYFIRLRSAQTSPERKHKGSAPPLLFEMPHLSSARQSKSPAFGFPQKWAARTQTAVGVWLIGPVRRGRLPKQPLNSISVKGDHNKNLWRDTPSHCSNTKPKRLAAAAQADRWNPFSFQFKQWISGRSITEFID